MRNFILGVVFTVLLMAVGGLAYLLLGFAPTNADAQPSRLESWIASGALDTSMEKRAPHLTNPVPPTDSNLIEGMKIYTMNCALCHGALDKKPSPLNSSFYPPPPQLVVDPLDDPEWHIFYAVRTGVRYTGMPAWSKALSEQDIWKVTGFLSRLDKLPPGAKEYWQKTFGVSPEAAGEHEEHHTHHEH
ncbi:MAG: cytochrome c [Acidobacteria bacterium]|nr:cytochrome c [Acidobacteriota bacterium]MBV9479454.1 cytochrome c [Acidobacteriota bacterium]